jgi:hypothetical protein
MAIKQSSLTWPVDLVLHARELYTLSRSFTQVRKQLEQEGIRIAQSTLQQWAYHRFLDDFQRRYGCGRSPHVPIEPSGRRKSLPSGMVSKPSQGRNALPWSGSVPASLGRRQRFARNPPQVFKPAYRLVSAWAGSGAWPVRLPRKKSNSDPPSQVSSAIKEGP